MPDMGLYCKAYPATRLREFPGWTEKISPLVTSAAPKSVEGSPDSADSVPPLEYFYLQEDYTVTAGIFLRENVAYDYVTPEWKAFCTEVLRFEIPEDLRVSMPENA